MNGSKTDRTTTREEELWNRTTQLLRQGVGAERISEELVRQKWPAESANKFVGLAKEYEAEYRSSAQGHADRRRRILVDLQIGGLWLVGALVLGLLTQYWPKSEMLPFIAGLALIYGLYEVYASRMRHRS